MPDAGVFFSSEHVTVPHGEPLEQGAGGGAEERKEKAPISSVPRQDTHRKGMSTVYQLKTYSQTSNRLRVTTGFENY